MHILIHTSVTIAYLSYESKYFCMTKTKIEVTLRLMFNWNVDYRVRKHPFSSKSFGRYKLVEMHLKHTMLTRDNAVSI